MDAVEFLKALERRRNYKRGPNDGHCNWAFIYFDHRSHEELVAEVEQWAKEHPAKTRQSEFLKMFPNASLDGGVINIFPCVVDNSIWEECDKHVRCKECSDCSQNYWLQEVE